MSNVIHLTYSSSLSNLCNINSSFDSAVLRVAYTNENRNGSFISKEAYERSINTIYNCPIVANYRIEDNSIGGHDCEIVNDDNGLHFVNITEPCGVVPESARYWWENIEEKDGSVHEYLCVDVLLWKRQEVYQKIKEDGIVSESMEICAKDGRFNKQTGLYEINDFEFNAFCLLGDGIEPCFEQASLELFSANDFKDKMSEMMSDLKETFTLFNTQDYEIDINKKYAKGGNEKLEEKLALVKEFGMDIDTLDFAIDDYSVEELRTKLEDAKQSFDIDNNDTEENINNNDNETANEIVEDVDNVIEDVCEPDSETGCKNDFALNEQIRDGIYKAVCDGEKIETEWGLESRYWMEDFDISSMEVYVRDCNDWNLYGFPYSMNGDNIVIDWSCKKRKKFAIVDFDEGETATNPIEAFSHFEEEYHKKINELKEFKACIEAKNAETARNEVFAQFDDLNDIEAFEKLKESASEYDAQTLEEKCFAIRGRMNTVAKFSIESKPAKIVVDTTNNREDELYGGLFSEYGCRSV